MKKIFLFLFALLITSSVIAQVSSYTFSQSSGTFTPITGGTVLGTGTSMDDNVYNANPLGFIFFFNGTYYTQFSVNANGWLCLGATAVTSYVPISGGTSNNVVSAAARDLQGSTTAELRYELLGTAPNRTLVVQWLHFSKYGSGGTGDDWNFQIRLNETTEVASIVYGTFTVNATTQTVQVGIRGNATTDFNNRTTTTDWSATTAGAVNTDACTLSTTIFPASGLTFAYTPTPPIPPYISYTGLLNTSSAAARTLSTTIYSPNGIPTTGTGLPMLYWRINTGTWNSVAGVFVSGNTYTFTFGSGVVLADAVQYYIVVQDALGTPNLAVSPAAGAGALTPNPPAAAAPPTTPSSYTIIPSLCGTFNVGVGQTYTTIGAAITDLAAKEITCPVTFLLTDNTYTETLPLIIPSIFGASSVNTVTFKPAPTKTPVISGSSPNGVLVLYGCNYVIIDGSNSGGTDKSMTWENTNTAAGTYSIGVFNDGVQGASNCTVKNCLIRASSQVTNTTYAVILNYSGGGYNNIVFDNNTIYSARYGMQFAGVAGNIATNGQITNNIFGSTVDAQALQYRGILMTYCDNTLIQGNEIMGASLGNVNYSQAGIYLSTACTNTKIRQNKIHDWYYTGTGGWGNWGLYFTTGSALTPTEISNNQIYNIKGDGYSTTIGSSLNTYGMYFSSGGNVQLYFNSINLTGNVTSSSYANYSACICISSACSLFDIRDNILKNSLQPVSGTPLSKTFAVIDGGSSVMFSNINYNDYFVDGYSPNIGYLTAAQTTLANWQAATAQDVNSVNVDPAFVSATNLHPTAGTLNNQGTYMAAFPADFDNNLRTNPPDMGVYNFGNDPIVTTAAATAVASSTATLNGTINANGGFVDSFFDYGLTTAYGSSFAGTPLSVNGLTATPISYGASGLSYLTTYHYRARGVAGGGLIIYGPDMTFTTMSPPTVVTTAATAITATGATLNGTVNANTFSTTVTFEYGLTTAYGTSIAGVPGTVTGNTVTSVNAPIGSLTPNTLYHYRVNGVNAGGTANGTDLTFTTLPNPPAVVTTAATAVLPTSATINGTVNANGVSSAVSFDYGLTTAYGSTIAGVPSPVTGSSVTAVSADLGSLIPCTTYHFRVNATNTGGTGNGLDLTFTTAPALATVVTNAATNVNLSTATVNGTITSNCSTTVTFEYGTTTAYGSTAPGVPSPVTGNVATSVSANLTSLLSNTLYHYRVRGLNGAGTADGLDMTFSTVCPIAGPTGPISGPANVCQGGSGYVYTATSANATGYVWTLPIGATVTSGANTSSITVSYAYNALPGYLFVYGTAPCGNGSPSQMAIAVNAPATPSITGPASACINSTGNVYTTQTGMTAYLWTVSAGGVITAGQGTSAATITWNTVGAKTVSVNYNNANGCAGLTPADYSVTVNPLPVPVITGPTPACTNFPVVYSTDAGMTGYVWTVSAGGTITGGQGTSAINVTWTTTGAKTVTATYSSANGCAAAAPTVMNVTVNGGAAPTITGLASVCVNSGYITYTTETGMTNYNWQVSPGGVINFGAGTNSIMVTWNGTGNQWVRASYTNANGCAPPAPTQLDVVINPAPDPAGVITGPSAICAGATGIPYTVNPILYAAAYVWTLPAGATIATGAGTNSITVDFATNATPGDITVYGNNLCGNGTPSPAHAIVVSPVPAAAGTISGMTAICTPAEGVVYTVEEITGATGYDWVVPAGATIVAGENTNSITVDFSEAAVAGAITVSGTNDCGNGTVSPNLDITVTPIPETPVITQLGDVLTSSATSGNQWFMNDVSIPGATDQTYTAIESGDYFVVVTINGCSSAESNHIDVIVGIEDLKASGFQVYPIPNDGRFTVTIVTPSKETYTISVFNNIGMKIFEEGNIVVNGTLNKAIDLKPVSQGIYSVVLQNGKKHIEKKILINK